MFSSIECAIKWAHSVLGIDTCTYVPLKDDGSVDASTSFCVVERTGGELDYPHDAPEIAFQVWAKTEDRAETLANMLAIATKTMPIDDMHVNGMETPTLVTYGREAGGWFVWQVSVVIHVSLRD